MADVAVAAGRRKSEERGEIPLRLGWLLAARFAIVVALVVPLLRYIDRSVVVMDGWCQTDNLRLTYAQLADCDRDRCHTSRATAADAPLTALCGRRCCGLMLIASRSLRPIAHRISCTAIHHLDPATP